MSSPEYATLTDDDLVTGEAVALDLPPAGIGARMASGLVDIAATLVILIVVTVVLSVASIGGSDALAGAAAVGVAVVVFVVYPTTFETLTRGRSLGKLALGLRTVRDDAGPISFQHAFLRSIVGFVEIYALLGTPAFFSMLVSRRGKRLGDFACGSYVVRERVRLQLPSPPPMPPHLASWASGADIVSLPTGLALGVRQYLGRYRSLEAASRAEVGARLARAVSEHVAPPPPAGTRPEDFLAAVVATRRERDLLRLRREDELRHRLTRGERSGR